MWFLMVDLAVLYYLEMANNDVFNLMITFGRADNIDDRCPLAERALLMIIVADL